MTGHQPRARAGRLASIAHFAVSGVGHSRLAAASPLRGVLSFVHEFELRCRSALRRDGGILGILDRQRQRVSVRPLQLFEPRPQPSCDFRMDLLQVVHLVGILAQIEELGDVYLRIAD